MGGVMLEQALLTAIVLNPYDDLARKAYADWLEENGRPQPNVFISDNVIDQRHFMIEPRFRGLHVRDSANLTLIHAVVD